MEIVIITSLNMCEINNTITKNKKYCLFLSLEILCKNGRSLIL